MVRRLSRPCRRCHEQPRVAGALPWFVALPLWFWMDHDVSDAYCRDCANGVLFMGLLVLALLAGAGMFVAIAWR